MRPGFGFRSECRDARGSSRAPLLVAAVLVVRRHHAWAGVACGIALLVKVPAVFGLVALLVVVLVVPGGGRLVERAVNHQPDTGRGPVRE